MRFRSLVAHALASAFLVGPWKQAALRRLAAEVLGVESFWVPALARAVRRRFSEPPEGEEGIARLAAFIESYSSFPSAFVGREVPRIRRWLGRPPAMGATPWPVPPAATLVELARVLEVEPNELEWFADGRRYLRRNHNPRLDHYHRTWLPKRSGGYRLIEVPKSRIKVVQRRVLRRILDAIPAHAAAQGFVRGRSAITHAARHVGQAAVLCLDLEDFFTSIPYARVFHVFRAAGYPAAVARTLAGVCTTALPVAELARFPRPDGLADLPRHRRLRVSALGQHLPQGAPTSPALANLCAIGLDRRLMGAAAAVGAEYSRYADDLTFSGGDAFARQASNLATLAGGIALDEGFEVNFRKTRVMRSAARQRVCGVVVNQGTNVPREDYDRLKAMLTNCHRHGPTSQNRDGRADFRSHLSGRVAWVEAVAPARGAKLRALFDAIDWAERRGMLSRAPANVQLPGLQLGRISSDRCREVEAALIAAGYLQGKPSALELQYPAGGSWHIPVAHERWVIAVSSRPTDGTRWVLRIELAAPLRPRVIFRTAPSSAQINAGVAACHEIALALHAVLQPLCPELRWEGKDAEGRSVISSVPVEPPQLR